ncbi:MAG: HAD-IA family hydrolase [Firmicutes bacterium]|nr:HAD-IA family hydrolase [Bacillota bacterium]
MEIKTLLLDIGGVVLLTNPEFWTYLHQQHGAPENVEQLFYGHDSPWGACRTGLMTYDEYTREMARQLDMDPAELIRLRRQMEWIVNVPMTQWVRQQRNQGLEVIAISNADDRLEQHLREFGVVDLFDHIINSARVGFAKPDPEIYQAALKATATPPELCLFVDDRIRNMPPAEDLGIQTWVYTDFEAFSQGIETLLDIGS